MEIQSNMSFTNTHQFTSGKFLVTPMSRSHGEGLHTAILSIRRGSGSQTHDRIYSFKPEFKSKDSALMYATAQGHVWMLHPESFA
jgi:hypothetical protein